MKFQYFHNHKRNCVYLNIMESNIWTRICVLIFMSRDKIGTIVDKVHTDIQIMWRHLNILADKVYILVTKRVKVAVNRNIYIYIIVEIPIRHKAIWRLFTSMLTMSWQWDDVLKHQKENISRMWIKCMQT